MPNEDISPRAAQVLELHKAGKNPTEIGAELGITSQGVHGHLSRLRRAGLIADKKKGKDQDNGRPEFNVATAFGEVRQTISRQQHELDAHIASIDRRLEDLEESKKALKKERADAERAKVRLSELEGTVVG